MVNPGRVACIATPFILSLGALVCVVLIFVAGTTQKLSTLDDFYFLKIDLSNFTSSANGGSITSASTDSTTILGSALRSAVQSHNVKDYYTIYLRGWCSWNTGDDAYANCTAPQAYAWFDPVNVWHLNSTSTPVDSFLNKSLVDGLKVYKDASKAMYYLYLFALCASGLTVVVGITAIFSRLGSFFTTLVAKVASALFIAASVLMSIVFLILKTALNKQLKNDYGVVTSIGNKSFTLSWIGTALAVGAGFFWLFSVCCCSGRSPYNKHGNDQRRTRAEKTPYTYERVGSPYMGHKNEQNVPLQQYHGGAGFGGGQGQEHVGSAYEPFRPHV